MIAWIMYVLSVAPVIIFIVMAVSYVKFPILLRTNYSLVIM